MGAMTWTELMTFLTATGTPAPDVNAVATGEWVDGIPHWETPGSNPVAGAPVGGNNYAAWSAGPSTPAQVDPTAPNYDFADPFLNWPNHNPQWVSWLVFNIRPDIKPGGNGTLQTWLNKTRDIIGLNYSHDQYIGNDVMSPSSFDTVAQVVKDFGTSLGTWEDSVKKWTDSVGGQDSDLQGSAAGAFHMMLFGLGKQLEVLQTDMGAKDGANALASALNKAAIDLKSALATLWTDFDTWAGNPDNLPAKTLYDTFTQHVTAGSHGSDWNEWLDWKENHGSKPTGIAMKSSLNDTWMGDSDKHPASRAFADALDKLAQDAWRQKLTSLDVYADKFARSVESVYDSLSTALSKNITSNYSLDSMAGAGGPGPGLGPGPSLGPGPGPDLSQYYKDLAATTTNYPGGIPDPLKQGLHTGADLLGPGPGPGPNLNDYGGAKQFDQPGPGPGPNLNDYGGAGQFDQNAGPGPTLDNPGASLTPSLLASGLPLSSKGNADPLGPNSPGDTPTLSTHEDALGGGVPGGGTAGSSDLPGSGSLAGLPNLLTPSLGNTGSPGGANPISNPGGATPFPRLNTSSSGGLPGGGLAGGNPQTNSADDPESLMRPLLGPDGSPIRSSAGTPELVPDGATISDTGQVLGPDGQPLLDSSGHAITAPPGSTLGPPELAHRSDNGLDLPTTSTSDAFGGAPSVDLPTSSNPFGNDTPSLATHHYPGAANTPHLPDVHSPAAHGGSLGLPSLGHGGGASTSGGNYGGGSYGGGSYGGGSYGGGSYGGGTGSSGNPSTHHGESGIFHAKGADTTGTPGGGESLRLGTDDSSTAGDGLGASGGSTTGGPGPGMPMGGMGGMGAGAGGGSGSSGSSRAAAGAPISSRSITEELSAPTGRAGGSTTSSGSGMPMMPMTGGAGGNKDNEKRTSTIVVTEDDEEVWSATGGEHSQSLGR